MEVLAVPSRAASAATIQVLRAIVRLTIELLDADIEELGIDRGSGTKCSRIRNRGEGRLESTYNIEGGGKRVDGLECRILSMPRSTLNPW